MSRRARRCRTRAEICAFHSERIEDFIELAQQSEHDQLAREIHDRAGKIIEGLVRIPAGDKRDTRVKLFLDASHLTVKLMHEHQTIDEYSEGKGIDGLYTPDERELLKNPELVEVLPAFVKRFLIRKELIPPDAPGPMQPRPSPEKARPKVAGTKQKPSMDACPTEESFDDGFTDESRPDNQPRYIQSKVKSGAKKDQPVVKFERWSKAEKKWKDPRGSHGSSKGAKRKGAPPGGGASKVLRASEAGALEHKKMQEQMGDLQNQLHAAQTTSLALVSDLANAQRECNARDELWKELCASRGEQIGKLVLAIKTAKSFVSQLSENTMFSDDADMMQEPSKADYPAALELQRHPLPGEAVAPGGSASEGLVPCALAFSPI